MKNHSWYRYYPKLLSFAVFLSGIGFATQCKTRGNGNSESLSHSAEAAGKEAKFGFYAIDGSGNTCQPADPKDLTAICQLGQASDNAVNAYYEGVKDFQMASDMGNINNTVVQRICQDLADGKVTKVMLTGYSRGAISALTIGSRVNKECKLPNGAKDKPVVWIGLLDAVETSIWTFGRLPRDVLGKRSVPDGAAAIHVHKSPIRQPEDKMGSFETTEIRVAPNSESSLEVKTISDIGHGEIGRGIVNGTKLMGEEFEGYRLLKEHAIRFGARFK